MYNSLAQERTGEKECPPVSNVVSFDRFGQSYDRDRFNISERPFNPIALSLSDQVTAAQTKIVRNLARECGSDVDSISERLYCCEFGELSRQAAERMIIFFEKKKEALQNEVPLRLVS
jgi:hypothetical protein